MIQITAGDVPATYHLLCECIPEAGMQERFTPDECLAWLQGGVESGKVKVFLDDIGEPKAIVVLLIADHPSVFPRDNPTMTVMLVFSTRSHRSAEVFNRMVRIIEAMAVSHGRKTIFVSEWCSGTTPAIGKLWESRGYRKQEEIYYLKL